MYASSKLVVIVLILILLISFLIRIVGIDFGYPWLIQYDEDGEIIPCAFDILDFGQSHGVAQITHNGPFLKYVMALILGIWGSIGALFTSMDQMIAVWKSSTLPFIVGRIFIGVIPGTLLVYVTFLIGRRLKGEITGLLAAFLMCFAFKAVEFSHYATSDITSVLFIALVLHFSLRIFDLKKLSDVRWAAIFWAAATATKLSAAPAVVIPLTAVISIFIFERKIGMKYFLNLVFFSFISLLFFHLPYIFRPLDFVSTVLSTLLIDVNLFYKGFFWYFRPDVYPVNELPTAGIGFTLLIVSAFGLLLSIKPKARNIIIIVFPIVFYLVVGNASVKHTRYFLPVLPFLIIWAALALSMVYDFFLKLSSPRAAMIILVMVTLILNLPNIANSVVFSLQAANGNTVLKYNDEITHLFEDNTPWLQLGFVPLKHPIPGKYVSLDIFSSAKSKLASKSRAKFKSNLIDINSIVEKHVLNDSLYLEVEDSKFDPKSIIEHNSIEYAVIDEYFHSLMTDIPEECVKEREEYNNGAAMLKYISSNFALVSEILPEYNLKWGESIAGRQPVVWIYRRVPDRSTDSLESAK